MLFVSGNSRNDLQVETAKTILCIKEGNMITEIATNRIVEHMENITELHLERVKVSNIYFIKLSLK